MTSAANIIDHRENGCEEQNSTFTPSWKKAIISAALFILPIVTFGFSGMVVF